MRNMFNLGPDYYKALQHSGRTGTPTGSGSGAGGGAGVSTPVSLGVDPMAATPGSGATPSGPGAGAGGGGYGGSLSSAAAFHAVVDRNEAALAPLASKLLISVNAGVTSGEFYLDNSPSGARQWEDGGKDVLGVHMRRLGSTLLYVTRRSIETLESMDGVLVLFPLFACMSDQNSNVALEPLPAPEPSTPASGPVGGLAAAGGLTEAAAPYSPCLSVTSGDGDLGRTFSASELAPSLDPVRSVVHLMRVLLESSPTNLDRIQSINVFGVLGYLLERVPSVYLTQDTFDAVAQLVESRLVVDPFGAGYKQVLFNLGIWTRARRSVQLHVCQRLHNIVCADRGGVCRCLGSILPLLSALWGSFGYVAPPMAQGEGPSGRRTGGAGPSGRRTGGAGPTPVGEFVAGGRGPSHSRAYSDASSVGGGGAGGGVVGGAGGDDDDDDSLVVPVIRKWLFMTIAELLQCPELHRDIMFVLKGIQRLRVEAAERVEAGEAAPTPASAPPSSLLGRGNSEAAVAVGPSLLGSDSVPSPRLGPRALGRTSSGVRPGRGTPVPEGEQEQEEVGAAAPSLDHNVEREVFEELHFLLAVMKTSGAVLTFDALMAAWPMRSLGDVTMETPTPGHAVCAGSARRAC
jgi:hypothetical protein